jgi:hypothetical protein
LDVLDAAVYQALPGLARGWCDFVRTSETLGSVVYTLSQKELGDRLGQVILRKLAADLCEMTIMGPDKIKVNVQAHYHGDVLQAWQDAKRAAKDLDVRRETHFRQVIDLMWSLLDLNEPTQTPDAMTPAIQGATGAGTVKTKVGKLRREFAAACVAIKQAYTARGEDCTLERAVEDFYRAHPEIDKYKSEGLGGRTAQHLHDDLSDLRKAEGAIAWPEWKDL